MERLTSAKGMDNVMLLRFVGICLSCINSFFSIKFGFDTLCLLFIAFSGGGFPVFRGAFAFRLLVRLCHDEIMKVEGEGSA
jgi:hypothetical protein